MAIFFGIKISWQEICKFSMTLDAGKQKILFVTLVLWLNYSSEADVTNLSGSLQLQLKSKTTKILLIKFVNTVVMPANKRFPLHEDTVNLAAVRKTKLQSFLLATIAYFHENLIGLS